MTGWRERFFSVAVTAVSRALLARDALLGTTRGFARAGTEEAFYFQSGARRLAGVWVPGREGTPVVLLCHGVGETDAHWCGVQAWLAERGVGSLFFNYSGYGRSEGPVGVAHCEEDCAAAYAELRRRIGAEADAFVLGFSLGSGIAANGVSALDPPPAGLILCEAYTSFREAACACGAPRWVAKGLPNVWDTVGMAPSLRIPVLVMHSDGDRLFPVAMARRIAAACGARGELVVVPGLTHNQPYLEPTELYWGPIVGWMVRIGANLKISASNTTE